MPSRPHTEDEAFTLRYIRPPWRLTGICRLRISSFIIFIIWVYKVLITALAAVPCTVPILQTTLCAALLSAAI